MKSRLILAIALLVPVALSGQVADTLAHPIRTHCGVPLDPVGFVLGRAEELGLTQEEKSRLETLGERVAEENRPLGRRFWAAAGTPSGQEERRAVLFELRMNYRDALARMREMLGPERWEVAFSPPEQEEAQGVVRCLARSIPTLVGTGTDAVP